MDFLEIMAAITHERKSQNISQQELASLSGLSRGTIQKIDQQSIDEIGLAKVINLLDTLGYELELKPKGRPPTLEELRGADHA